MKATGEVMSICHNFEGALMKAIRSLEQHVDSLMSYDFTGLTEDQLIEELAVVDDRRIWKLRKPSEEIFPRNIFTVLQRSIAGSLTRSQSLLRWSRR